MQQTLFAFSMIALTVIAYLTMNKIYKRYPNPFLIPALSATFIVVVILLLCHISYTDYMIGGQWIHSFLGPSVVALAYPLYKQREFLMKNLFPIVSGVLIGSMTGMVSVVVFAKLFHIDEGFILSIIPKSITTPVAIEIDKSLGSNPSTTIISVMFAGLSGAIIAPSILKLARVHSPIGRGIALGSASHAIGTAKAAEYSELTFSISSVTMTLSAIIGSFLGPLIVWMFHM